MATIDFSKITVQTVDGGTEVKDYREYIGRQLYNQSHDETGFNLAKKIFGSNSKVNRIVDKTFEPTKHVKKVNGDKDDNAS